MALDGGIAVQDVDYDQLREHLLADGQILHYEAPAADSRGTDPGKLKGIVVDDEAAKFEGNWEESGAAKGYIGFGYRHDGNTAKGTAKAVFTTSIQKAGNYAVRLAYPPNNNRASNARVVVSHADGEKVVTVDQKKAPSHELFHELGVFEFPSGATATVTLSNEGSDGYVVVDAVQWVEVE
jgi:hypothetical protein